MQKNYQNDLQCHYSPNKVFLRNQRESFFVINVFLLVKFLVTRKTLYISILLIESLLTIDIYLQLMGFTLSNNLWECEEREERSCYTMLEDNNKE